jgi:hypothetical protein
VGQENSPCDNPTGSQYTQLSLASGYWCTQDRPFPLLLLPAAGRVSNALSFKELVYLGIDESRVAAKIETLHSAPAAGDLQHRAPAVGAMDVARPKRVSLHITDLMEHEQRVINGVARVTVIGVPSCSL